LLFGGITLAWSILCWFLIPDSPLNAWFLSKEDQVKAIERVQDNLTGIKNHHFKRYQVVEALLDPKTWLLALFQFTQNVPNGGAGSVRIAFFDMIMIMILTQSNSLLQS
jgi:hypothetical protein